MAGEVRQKIDQASLERYLNKHAPEIKTPLGLKQFGFGQSNPTYQITDSSNKKYVLRKKPPGKLLSKTAHRVDREYAILHALEKTDVPVPRAIVFCEDENVIGTQFYVMDFLDGRMIQNPAFPDVSQEDRRAMWKDAARTLAKLHRVRPGDVGLDKFGRASGFYNRQIKTFSALAKSQGEARDKETGEEVGQLPHFEDFVQFYGRNQPEDRGVLFHGDYKIDNLVFHKTEPRVIGILDWEMATIGHPYGDLTNLIQPWTISTATDRWPVPLGDQAFLPESDPKSKAKEYPGLPTRDEVVQWYQEEAGFKITARELTWASAFALFRDSIIFQGIAARYATRQATSEKAQEYGDNRNHFAEMSWKKVQEAKAKEGSSSKL